jgi:hypothetical protein
LPPGIAARGPLAVTVTVTGRKISLGREKFQVPKKLQSRIAALGCEIERGHCTTDFQPGRLG